MNKEDDLMVGALKVFARDGYSRSSIVTIAAEARVSTRTVYNRYKNKAGLFHAVITYSTRRMADHHISLIRHAASSNSLHRALRTLAIDLVTPDSRFDDHHALVRQVQAERSHIPQATLDSWVSLGPVRVRAYLADQLRRLFAEAPAPLSDPSEAATTLLLLIGGDPIARGFYEETPYNSDYVVSLAIHGVEVFLSAYAPTTL